MINTVMRTSLKLCTMKSLPVLKKNSNTQGCRSLLEVGEDNTKSRTKKITKVKLHQYSKTKYGVVWHAEAKSGLSFGLALLCFLIGFWPPFVQIHIAFCRFAAKRQVLRKS